MDAYFYVVNYDSWTIDIRTQLQIPFGCYGYVTKLQALTVLKESLIGRIEGIKAWHKRIQDNINSLETVLSRVDNQINQEVTNNEQSRSNAAIEPKV